MRTNPALFVVHAPHSNETLAMTKRVHGPPDIVVHLLVAAVSGNRRQLAAKPGRLLPLIIGADDGRKSAHYELIPESAILSTRCCWRYDIVMKQSSRIDITVFRVDYETGDEQIHYACNAIELWFSKALRNRKRPIGRTPRGYRNRGAYETARATRPPMDEPPTAREQPSTEPDLRGVRVFSKEEARAPRRTGRTRQ